MLNKEAIIAAIRNLPEDASFEDVLERIYFLEKLHAAKEQVEQGRLHTTDEAKERLKAWLK